MGDEKFWTRTICLLWASLLAVILILMFFGGGPADANTVTFTDAGGQPTETVQLPEDGHFKFRIQAPGSTSLPIEAVLVTDDTGQMAPGCYPIQNGQTIAVTSELVVAAQPIVEVTGRSYEAADCTGDFSEKSNPIIVTFVPEPPGLLAPLAP